MNTLCLWNASLVWLLAAALPALCQQQGSLLQNGDFEAGTDAWYDWAKGSGRFSVQPGRGANGSAGAVLEVVDDGSRPLEYNDRAVISSHPVTLRGATVYRLDGALRGDADLSFRIMFSASEDGRERALPGQTLWGAAKARANTWQHFDYAFSAPAPFGDRGQARIAFFVKRGSLVLDDLRLEAVAAEDARVLTLAGQVLVTDQVRNREAEWPDTDRDILFFQGDEPGSQTQADPGAFPAAADRVNRINTFAARGDQARLWCGFVARRELRAPFLQLTELRGPGNAVLAPAPARFARIRTWPQKVGRVGAKYALVSELLEPLPRQEGRHAFPATVYDTDQALWTLQDTAVIPAQTPVRIWVELDVPRDCAPGPYRGELRVGAENLPEKTLPVLLLVLPFELSRPDPAKRVWMMYADTQRWHQMSDAQILAELEMLKSSGYECVRYRGQWTPQIDAGRVTGMDTAPWRRHLALIRRAQLEGPVIVSQQRLPELAARWLGLEIDADAPRTWPAELWNAITTALEAVHAVFEAEGIRWFLYPEDEIHRTEEQKKARVFLPMLREHAPHIPITVTTDITLSRELGTAIDLPILNVRFAAWTEEVRAEATGYSAESGKPLWWYGSGDYGGQEGNIARNRYVAGALFWKSAAAGHASWGFQRQMGQSPWNDFDGRTKDVMIVYPPLPGSAAAVTETLKWKGLEEGIRDCWYLHTLEKTLAAAVAAPESERRTVAENVAREYSERLAGIPWHQSLYLAPITNAQLAGLRWWAALKTLILRGETSPVPPAVSQDRALSVRFAETPIRPHEAELTRPARKMLYAAPLDAGLQIDGRLEPAWQQSAEALAILPWEGTAADAGQAPATRVYLAYDTDYLYVGFDCEEPWMDKLKENARTPRDKVWRDDSIELCIDADLDQRSFYQWILNSGGVLIEKERTLSGTDTPIAAAQAAVWKGPDRWQAELRLPLAKFFPAGPGLGAIALIRNRWIEAQGRRSKNAQYYLLPADRALFGAPDRWLPLAFRNPEFEILGWGAGSARLGENLFFCDLRTDPGASLAATPTIEGDPGARIVRLEQKTIADGTRLILRYELDAPGNYAAGIRLGQKTRQWVGVERSLETILTGPDYNKQFYTKSDQNAEFAYTLDCAAAHISRLAIDARLERGGAPVGAPVTARVGSADVRVAVDMTALPPGRYDLKVALKQADSDQSIARQSTGFERIPGVTEVQLVTVPK